MTALKQKIIEAATTIADRRLELDVARAELAKAESALEGLLDGLRGGDTPPRKARAVKDEPEAEREPTAAVRRLRAEKPQPNAGIPAKPGRKPGQPTIVVQVEAAIRKADRPMTGNELQNATGASLGGLHYALERLIATKRVKRSHEAGFFEAVRAEVAQAS